MKYCSIKIRINNRTKAITGCLAPGGASHRSTDIRGRVPEDRGSVMSSFCIVLRGAKQMVPGRSRFIPGLSHDLVWVIPPGKYSKYPAHFCLLGPRKYFHFFARGLHSVFGGDLDREVPAPGTPNPYNNL